MTSERRSNVSVDTEALRDQLNDAQRRTLGELELLGWALKFVRRPLFQDPVPVIVNDSNNEIGLLDPDGKIIIETVCIIRADNDEQAPDNRTALDEVNHSPDAIVVKEMTERRNGENPIPANLSDYLSRDQVNALRQIENFGWELQFVRRPLFQNPVAVIINTSGDRAGTLDSNGRLDLQHEIELRRDTTRESGKSEPASDSSRKKHCR